MSSFYSFAKGVVAPLFAIIFGRMNVLQKENSRKAKKVMSSLARILVGSTF